MHNPEAKEIQNHNRIRTIHEAALTTERVELPPEYRTPVTALGHSNGSYYFLSPAGELLNIRAESLESGRGVRALFEGMGEPVEEWCRWKFSALDNDWCPKKAGRWIIAECNAKGLFDPANAMLNSVGVWRTAENGAVAHCGDCTVDPRGRVSPLGKDHSGQIMIGAAAIARPDIAPPRPDTFKDVLHELEQCWGWKRPEDATIWLGWTAAASLGGYPDWRSHLYVHGCRGSGKSGLIELASTLLGDAAGGVVNDATEAGLRQLRNNRAQPVLVDEFEPEDNPRTSLRQDKMLALFRGMSGGTGGRIARGGADHTAVSFRMLGAAYVTSINHIHLQPQDRSRFVFVELKALPASAPPDLYPGLRERCRSLSTKFRGRMLVQSLNWDTVHARIAARAKRRGADSRQADTAATVLAGLDLLLHDGPIGEDRLNDLDPLLEILISESDEADQDSEGTDALEFLLNTTLPLDHGLSRSVRELVNNAMFDDPCEGTTNPIAELGRFGVHPLRDKAALAIRLGGSTPVAKLFANTKWRNGAHVSALAKLDGVYKPENPVRLAPSLKQRALLIPAKILRSSPI